MESDNILLEDGVVINNGGDYDLLMVASVGNNITLLNVSLDKSNIDVQSGTLWVKQEIRLHAYNGGGDVTVTFDGENLDGSESIFDDGVETSSWYNVTEFKETSTTRTYYIPWSFNITLDSSSTNKAMDNYDRKINFTSSGTYNIYLFPCEGNFKIKSGSSNGPNVLLIDKYGQMWINGSLDEAKYCDDFSDIRFCLERTSGEIMIGVSNNGKLYQSTDHGGIKEYRSTITPSGNNDFIIKNNNGQIVAMIDEYGTIYLKRAFESGASGAGYYQECS